ncbi:MAG TPA: hypothetical protein VI259_04505 [Gemmatimonadaceae bacterium]
MFRTKLTLAGLVLATTIGAAAPVAQADPARHMQNYLNAPSSAAGHDNWYGYALSLTRAQQSIPFITDTLAPGGTAPVQSYRFITDTLAPGGGPSVVSGPLSNGFNWGDAGIGAGATAGIALLLLASGRVLQSRRRVVAV